MHDEKTKGPLLVDTRTAARMLSASPRKLWLMTFVGQPAVPHVRLGRLVRYQPDDLRRWIEGQTVGGNA